MECCKMRYLNLYKENVEFADIDYVDILRNYIKFFFLF